MLSILLLILTLALSALVVRVGAIALEITGLPEEKAYFQALSAFVGVGFTTRETELVMNHPERRRIIKMMIRLGGAGVITSIASLAGALVSGPTIFKTFASNVHVGPLPLNAAQLTLIVLILTVYLLYHFLRKPALNRLVTEVISVWLLKNKVVKQTSIEELMPAGSDYGVFRVTINAAGALRGKMLSEISGSIQDAKLLLVEREGVAITSFPQNFVFKQNDIATFFGSVEFLSELTHNDLELGREDPTAEEIDDDPLAIGSLAPDFALSDQNGTIVRLSDLRGKKNVVILFYPKDHSYFCTKQVKELSEQHSMFHDLEAEVVAINPRSPQCHKNFCVTIDSKIRILSDPSKKTCRDYRALMLGGLLVNRSMYIIGKDGTIRFARRGRPATNELLAELKKVEKKV